MKVIIYWYDGNKRIVSKGIYFGYYKGRIKKFHNDNQKLIIVKK